MHVGPGRVRVAASQRGRTGEAQQGAAPAPDRPAAGATTRSRARTSWSSCSPTHGIDATQATVTRDLEDLGGHQGAGAGRRAPSTPCPSCPSDRLAPEDHLRRVLGEWVVEVASSANLVVLRTPPGSAHVVGSAIDRSGLAAIIGTVAGDDTVLVIVLDDDRRHGGGRRAGRAGRTRSRLMEAETHRRRPVTKKVVLAYSGGLDTSVCVRWMIEEWGVEVITLSADVGQEGTDWEAIQARALGGRRDRGRAWSTAARSSPTTTARPALTANALYENVVPAGLGALAPGHREAHGRRRPATYGADAVAHGCTGKGNDQVRFEVSTRSLAPDLEVLAPVREWGMTREESHRLRRRPRHPDHRHQGEDLLDRRQPLGPGHRVRRDGGPVGPATRGRLVDDHRAPSSEAREIVDRVRGRACRSASTVRRSAWYELIDAAQRHRRRRTAGVGSTWSRTAGSASRAARPTSAPAALALIMAHRDLEAICLERDLQREKIRLEHRYAELVYDGLWFSPLRQALDAFIDESPAVRHRRRAAPARARSLLRRRPAEPAQPVRLRPGHLRRRRLVRARRHRRASQVVGPRARDLVGGARGEHG